VRAGHASKPVAEAAGRETASRECQLDKSFPKIRIRATYALSPDQDCSRKTAAGEEESRGEVLIWNRRNPLITPIRRSKTKQIQAILFGFVWSCLEVFGAEPNPPPRVDWVRRILSSAPISFYTKIGDSQLLEQVGRGDSAVGVSSKVFPKIRMRECLVEILDRLPNGVIQKYAALANAFVKLGGNEAGLPLHPVGIGLPGLEERFEILRLHREDVDEDYWRYGEGKLAIDGEGGVERAKLHGGLQSGMCCQYDNI
jgi:hypothetical protein